jgi:hypothetical protein
MIKENINIFVNLDVGTNNNRKCHHWHYVSYSVTFVLFFLFFCQDQEIAVEM